MQTNAKANRIVARQRAHVCALLACVILSAFSAGGAENVMRTARQPAGAEEALVFAVPNGYRFASAVGSARR